MNATRRELIAALADLSDADPELRLGQMIVNLVNYIDWSDREQFVWHVEDEDLLRAARGLTATLLRRQPATSVA